jgi:transglutaminase-like putative cysteine protease
MIVTARLNFFICATVAVGITAFTIADEAWGLFFLGLIGSLVGYIAGRPDPSKPESGGRPWVLPRTAVNLLVFLAIVNAFLQASIFRDGQRPLVSTLGAFLTHVQLIKLVDRRAARDEAQLLGLSLFGVIAAILTSNSLPLGIALMIYTPLLVTSAMLTEINSASTTGIAHAAITVRSLFSQLRRVVGVSVLAACALAAGVFILTPRGIGNDLLGALGKTQRTEIGFTDNARLGASGFLNESQTPVLDLALFDADGRNVGDASRSVYLRGAVRDLYLSRGQWVSSSDPNSQREERADVNNRLEISPSVSEGAILYQRITPRSARRDGEDYFFHVWRPVWFHPSVSVEFKRSSVDYSIRRSGGGRAAGRGTYTFASALTDVEIVGYEPHVPDTFHSGPIAELTKQVLANIEPAAGRAAGSDAIDSDEAELSLSLRRRRDATRIRDYLQQTYAYSLEMVAPKEGQDPIEMFLFDTRRGHCEYFASAMVAMCQSIDIPARLVLGYVATDFNPFTGQYTVRESNAHAWVEVCIGEGRWISLDPSPPGDIDRIHRPPTGIASRLRALYELLEFNWNESVVGFDSSRQRRMLGGDRSGRGTSGLFRRVEEAWSSFTRLLGIPADMNLGADFLRIVTWWLGLSILITLLIWIIWRKRRSILFRRLAHGEVDPELRSLLSQAAFYRTALKRLHRAGVSKPRSRAPIDHAAALSRRHPELADAFARLARHYYTLRFARRKLSDADLADADAALNALNAHHAQRTATTSPSPTPPANTG